MKSLFALCLAGATALAQTTAPLSVPKPRVAAAAAPAAPPAPVVAPAPPDGGTFEEVAPPPRTARTKRSQIAITSADGDTLTLNGQGGGAAIAGGGGGMGGDFLYSNGARAGRSLVIPSREADLARLPNMEEDLNVMARVLEKAISPGREDDEAKRFMGIEVHSLNTLLGNAGGLRNFHLEGYGALFTLNVRFPLLPPPEKSEEVKPKEPVSTEWDEAREELYGDRPAEGQFERAWLKSTRRKTEPYDPDKVEELKTSLLEALKNATHINDLKSDESITVVVLGGESARPKTPRAAGAARTGPRSGDAPRPDRDNLRSVNPRGETAMTMQVKKSDVDSFAKGKMNLDEFRKHVKIFSYVRRSDSPPNLLRNSFVPAPPRAPIDPGQ